VEIVIQTHLPGDHPEGNESRNHINALTATAVIGLPGGPGTLAEIKLADRYRRPWVTYLDNQDDIPGLSGLDPGGKRNVDLAGLKQFLADQTKEVQKT
jgi:hypothetical protein